MGEIVAYLDGSPSRGLVRLQQVEKKLLVALLDYCDTHQLHPFLVAGSALGAARHADIIPWDDDIDVGLVRDEFEQLIGLLERAPIPGMFIQSHRSEHNYPHGYAKLRWANSAVHELAFEGADIRDGVFIDIFPFDLLPASSVLRKMQRGLLIALSLVVMSFSRHTATVSPRAWARGMRRIAFFLRPILPWRSLIVWRENLSNPRSIQRSRLAVSFEMYGIFNATRTVIDIGCLLPTVVTKFGSTTAPVPNNLHRYLKGLFGDYQQLPPAAERRPVHIAEVEIKASADDDI